MNKLLTSLGLSFALATAAFAGPLNTKGIPANAIAVVHYDSEISKNNPLTQPIQNLFLRSKSEAKFYNEFKTKTGIDPLTDIYDVTIGILPPETEKDADAEVNRFGPKEPTGVVTIIRWKYSKEKLLAYIAEKQNKEVKQIAIGKHIFYKLDNDTLLLPLDSKTAVIVMGRKEIKPLAQATLAALSGKAKSYAPPSSLANLGKQTGTPILLSYVNVGPLQFPKPAQDDPMGVQAPDEIFLALGDSVGTLKLRVAATYPTDSEAQQLLAKAQMGIGFAQMSLGQAAKGSDGKVDPKKAKLIAEAGKILSALKVTTKSTYFNASLDYSGADLAKLVTNAVKEFGNGSDEDE